MNEPSMEAVALLRAVRAAVRAAMAEERLSIDDLAVCSGCSSRTIVRLLRGHDLRVSTVARLAAGLGRRVEVRLVAA